jgi:hypothetical protein
MLRGLVEMRVFHWVPVYDVMVQRCTGTCVRGIDGFSELSMHVCAAAMFAVMRLRAAMCAKRGCAMRLSSAGVPLHIPCAIVTGSCAIACTPLCICFSRCTPPTAKACALVVAGRWSADWLEYHTGRSCVGNTQREVGGHHGVYMVHRKHAPCCI